MKKQSKKKYTHVKRKPEMTQKERKMFEIYLQLLFNHVEKKEQHQKEERKTEK